MTLTEVARRAPPDPDGCRLVQVARRAPPDPDGCRLVQVARRAPPDPDGCRLVQVARWTFLKSLVTVTKAKIDASAWCGQ